MRRAILCAIITVVASESAPEPDPLSNNNAVKPDGPEPDPEAVQRGRDRLAAAAESIQPIDYQAALEAARAMRRQGASADDAAKAAEQVIAGEAHTTFVPTERSGWLLAKDFLSEADAKLLQHEVIRTEGWIKPTETESGLLDLHAPLPPWAASIADRLAVGPARAVFDQIAPDRCAVHACEPGQAADILDECCEGDVAAVLALGAPATLSVDEDDNYSTTLSPGGLLLLTPAEKALRHKVIGGSKRHLSLVLWRSASK